MGLKRKTANGYVPASTPVRAYGNDIINDSNVTGSKVKDALNTLNNKYTKPDSGIPSTDMSSAVQTSLGKADTALQDHSTAEQVTYDSTLSTHTSGSVGAALASQFVQIVTLGNEKEAKGKMTVGGTEYSVTRKPLVITDGGTTTTYYLADITTASEV